jgi:hypothetical protein
VIRITADTREEFDQLVKAMDLPQFANFEYMLSYSDPRNVPDGVTLGTSRTRNTIGETR